MLPTHETVYHTVNHTEKEAVPPTLRTQYDK
jgi:hypothetical protein